MYPVCSGLGESITLSKELLSYWTLVKVILLIVVNEWYEVPIINVINLN